MRFNIDLKEISEEIAFDRYYDGEFELTATRARFQYSQLDNTTIKSKAMKAIKSELGKISFNITEDDVLDHPIAYTFMYVQWEANEVISDELIRNLSLTFATIAVVSLLLVINLQVCLMVFISVVFSVTNVCGYAHFLGLTIEIVTSICLILSVGLALD